MTKRQKEQRGIDLSINKYSVYDTLYRAPTFPGCLIWEPKIICTPFEE